MAKVRLSAILGCFAVSALAVALTSCAGGGGSTTTPTTANLSGSYVFSVVGSDPSDGDYAVLGRFVADGKGTITSGVADYSLGSGIDSGVLLTGTYTVTNGVATIHLTDGGSVFDSFTTTLVTSGTAQIENFDSTGSGTLYPQDTTGFTTVGAYSYTMKGEREGTLTGSGNLVVGTANTFTGGIMSYMDGATLTNYPVVTGFIYPPQANSRGQAALVGNNLAYYVVSSKQILMIGLDDHSLLLITASKA